MRITDRLRAEHGVFLRQLRSLLRLLDDGASLEELGAIVEVLADAEAAHAFLKKNPMT